MSDTSFSPGSDFSNGENEDDSLYFISKKCGSGVTGIERKCQYSNERRILPNLSNNDGARYNRNGVVSSSDRPEHLSRSRSKLSSYVMRSKETKYTEKHVQLIDMEHFQNEMNKAHVCPGGQLFFLRDTKSAVGLFHQHTFECSICQTCTDVSNFPMKHPVRSTLQEPNARLYAASAITGAGYEQISTIMSLLCLSITTKKHFLEQTHRIHSNLHQFAQNQFESLVKQIRQSSNTNNSESLVDICVSLDGTWKRRGHVSNYGLVFLIHVETGYCIDYELLSLHCEVCDMNRSQLTEKAFERWYKSHKNKCFKNYNGTSKGMEAEGALRIFNRSIEKGLRYKWLVCDGDSSAFETVKHVYINAAAADARSVADKPIKIRNNNLLVEKVDCINHVKKRVINRLKDLKSRNTGYVETSPAIMQTVITDAASLTGVVDVAGQTGLAGAVAQAGVAGVAGVAGQTSVAGVAGEAGKLSLITESRLSTKQDSSIHKDQPAEKKQSTKLGQPTKGILKKQASSTKPVAPIQSRRSRKLLSDGKPFGGSSGRMTDTMMNKISDLYGLAIRQGIDEGKAHGDSHQELVNRLQKKCLAAFHHVINRENKEEQHRYCPLGASSWCSYQRDKTTKKKEDFVEMKKRLDPVFLNLLRKIIDDLTSKELLARCVRGLTQNGNESMNSVVWSILSKSKHHGFLTIQGAAAVASVSFNGGKTALLQFFEESGIEINHNLYFNFIAKDEKRIQKAELLSTRRDQIISQKSKMRQKSMAAENDATEYGPGLF